MTPQFDLFFSYALKSHKIYMSKYIINKFRLLNEPTKNRKINGRDLFPITGQTCIEHLQGVMLYE